MHSINPNFGNLVNGNLIIGIVAFGFQSDKYGHQDLSLLDIIVKSLLKFTHEGFNLKFAQQPARVA